MLHVACCTLYVACCMLHVACCTLHATCAAITHLPESRRRGSRRRGSRRRGIRRRGFLLLQNATCNAQHADAQQARSTKEHSGHPTCKRARLCIRVPVCACASLCVCVPWYHAARCEARAQLERSAPPRSPSPISARFGTLELGCVCVRASAPYCAVGFSSRAPGSPRDLGHASSWARERLQRRCRLEVQQASSWARERLQRRCDRLEVELGLV